MKPRFQLPGRIGWPDQLIGAGLATAYVLWLLRTAGDLGFARDEGFYFHAATQYAGWFRSLTGDLSRALTQSVVDPIWSANHEHPSLMKSLFALSWLLLHEKWKLFDQASTAFRFPGMCMSGVALWVTYLFGARAYSRQVGCVAALLLALMPRVFYHAHLAAFDMPITAMWTLCVYVYWRSVTQGGMGWTLLAGVVFGLTMETKHNAWILPAVFVPHALVVTGRGMLSRLRSGQLLVPSSLVSMALLGPLVFYALWPWMWNDTVNRWREYFNFHVNHVYYNMEFLGRNYFSAPSPRLYMPVMIAATVPGTTLLLFAVGAVERMLAGVRGMVWRLREHAIWRRTRAHDLAQELSPSTDLLIGLALLAAVSPWLLSSKTPIFGGTKHWMTAYPFLALLAGRGFEWCRQQLQVVLGGRRSPWVGQAIGVGLGALVLAPPLAVTVHSHPFGLTSYTPLVGGTRGGANLGLNRQFWGFTAQNANAAYLAAHAPKHATIFLHDTAWESWGRMVAEGRVRPDLRAVGTPGEAQLSLLQYELHMQEVEHQIWVAYDTRTPVFVVDHDEVPVVGIYARGANAGLNAGTP